MAKNKTTIILAKGKTYTFWAWKGDYINLGLGAETGFYEGDGTGFNRTATDRRLNMGLKLGNNKTGKTEFKYNPNDKEWWITAFDPQKQNNQAKDYTSTTTINLSNDLDIWDALYKDRKEYSEKGWTFDEKNHIAQWKW